MSCQKKTSSTFYSPRIPKNLIISWSIWLTRQATLISRPKWLQLYVLLMEPWWLWTVFQVSSLSPIALRMAKTQLSFAALSAIGLVKFYDSLGMAFAPKSK